MNKFLKAAALGLGVCLIAGLAGCGGSGNNPGGDNPGGNTPGGDNPGGTPSQGVTATIDFYTSVNIIEQRALESVAYAYEDYQYEKGNNISVRVRNNTDPDAYNQNLRNTIQNVSNPTIANTSVLPEYYGTDKIVDLTGYLEEKNPFIEGNSAWLDALEADAYRSVQSGSSLTVPGLSYSANYSVAFYNKAAMKAVMEGDDAVGADGTVDAGKISWSWMMNALKTAQEKTELNFKTPLALSRSAQSCGEDSFNMLARMINMYLDQYFRDFTRDVHSAEGEFSYVADIDAAWQYSANDPTIDATDKYTYNLNKIVDKYFNNAQTYGPSSARYKEVMENLYGLLAYSDATASYNDNFSRFNETTITFENKGGSYKDMKLFYIEDLNYVRTYRDAFKTEAGGVTTYPSGEVIGSELGWFLLPAMESSLEGVADNVRAFGGPNECFGVLSTGSTSKDEIAVDFLRFLLSPTGQSYIYATYVSENNAPIVSRQLVKDVEIPTAVDFTRSVVSNGDCSASPYTIFGKGTGMKNATVGGSNTYVKAQVGTILSDYFCGADKTWSGDTLFQTIKSGFASYAADSNLIYTDPANVASATNNLVNSPFNTTA